MTTNGRKTWVGVVFILAGLIPATLAASAAWSWFRARNWVAVDAEILSTEIASQSTSGGPGGRSSSSTKLYVKYSYRWADQEYQGDRVSPFNGIELFTSYKRELNKRWKKAQRGDQPTTCFVNPSDPQQAFLLRDFRAISFLAFVVFGLLFAGSGVLIVTGRTKR